MAIIGSSIKCAKQHLVASNVVAIPTETVYGLAGNACDEVAIEKIFHIKQRPRYNPLIVHVASLTQVRSITKNISTQALKLARTFWPGPLTLLLEKQPYIPDLVTAGYSHVAVRIPQHKVTLQLLRTLTFPLAAPSANPFGYISPTTPEHVQSQLGEHVPYILDGGSCSVGIESTIIGFEDHVPILYRLGGVDRSLIEDLVGPLTLRVQSKDRLPVASGALAHHYAPRKSLLIGNIPKLIQQYINYPIGILAFQHYYAGVSKERQVILSPKGDINEAAAQLFMALQILDNLPVSHILADWVPDTTIGSAINDRLRRAAKRIF